MQPLFVNLREDTYEGPRRTYVVLGVPRGGTSMMAGLLKVLGVFMGKDDGPQHEDPAFREETSIRDKKEAILEYNGKYEKWGWKLPNSIYYYANIQKHLINPVFITVYRNPMTVALSSSRHDGRPMDLSLVEVAANHCAAVNNIVKLHPAVPAWGCAYESVVRSENRGRFVKEVADGLRLETSNDVLEAAAEFLDPDTGYKEWSSA